MAMRTSDPFDRIESIAEQALKTAQRAARHSRPTFQVYTAAQVAELGPTLRVGEHWLNSDLPVTAQLQYVDTAGNIRTVAAT